MSLSRRVGIAAFVVYTVALVTATHWPGLAIRGPVSRTDLVVHFGAFFVWTGLLWLSGLVGWEAWRLLLVGLAFAVLDETTQPLFRRVFDVLDLVANGAGVAAASVAAAAWQRRRVRPGRRAGAGGGS